MALTPFQRDVLRLLAPSRLARESYVAGGTALNTRLAAPRRSRDLDLFHDTSEALAGTVAADRALLGSAGYALRFLREAPAFAEAVVTKGAESTLIQWTRDSAYRFFPLQAHEELGLTLHPFDLATNKVLAMAGRLEVRDWVDVMTCDERLQPLGFLVWAACGKDPGFGPALLVREIRRASRYSQAEVDLLEFEGPRPDAAALGRAWHAALRRAEQTIDALPAEEVGAAIVTADGTLFRGGPESIAPALVADGIRFHRGRIGGAWPTFPGS